ncbi:hypothetical protein GCM10010831_15870 [Psychroflexus salis]|uniref:Uncharacterized protein n=2 Tax=Psychroflexus salis TaxID=1526574 RepID=A0A916ZUW4_9FLAO|nr:hypothetical protein GCM10010831_15870 [Psychroflexus salis]
MIMKKRTPYIKNTKQQLIEDTLNSTPIKIIKYTVVGVAGIYTLGFIFKVLTFLNTNLKSFKNTLKQ